MVNWKVVLWCGVGGFALSLLVGIIGGVEFGALVLRALLWGLVFAALGGASHYVISRFLPELVAGGSTASPPETGENVDIVIPDENPHAPSAESAELADEIADEVSDEREMVEEVEEIPPGEERAPSAEGPPERDSFFSELSDDEERSLPDELPEFGGESNVFGGTAAAPRPSRGSKPADDVLGADPEEVAQAIRTVLRKDQKG